MIEGIRRQYPGIIVMSPVCTIYRDKWQIREESFGLDVDSRKTKAVQRFKKSEVLISGKNTGTK